MEDKLPFGVRVLNAISAISCPKQQKNERAKYTYRTTEDILQAANPQLRENELLLCISDEVEVIGGAPYIKATAYIYDPYSDARTPSAVGYAREGQMKLPLDGAQITGAASTYARRYALNALFCIDNTPDSDKLNGQNYTVEERRNHALEALARVDSRAAFEEAMRAHQDMWSDPEVKAKFAQLSQVYPKHK